MKEYVIKGENGFTTSIELISDDREIRVADYRAYEAAYIPLRQIDELISILQEIKKESE